MAPGIAKRACSMWRLEGRPSGRDLKHWLRAQTEHENQLVVRP